MAAIEYNGEVIPVAPPTAKEYTGEVVPPAESKKAADPRFENAEGLNELAGGIWDPLLRMGSNMVLGPIGDYAGLVAMAADLGDPKPKAVRNVLSYLLPGMDLTHMDPGYLRQLIQSQAYVPRTKAGASPYNPLNAIPQAIGKGLNYLLPGEAEHPATITGGLQNAFRAAVPQALSLLGMKYLAPAARAGAEWGAGKLMRSALSTPGVEDAAVKSMLDNGYTVSGKSLEQIKADIAEHGELLSKILESPEYSGTKIPQSEIIDHPAITDLQKKIGPENVTSGYENDLKKLAKLQDSFANNPVWKINPETGVPEISLAEAQALKTGTYERAYKTKRENKDVVTQTRKAQARALKEALDTAAPETVPINQKLSGMIPAKVAIEKALKNPSLISGLRTYGESLGAKSLYNSASPLEKILQAQSLMTQLSRDQPQP
jgi:hypothetical protein